MFRSCLRMFPLFSWFALAILAANITTPATVQGQVNLANGKPIIGGNSDYPAGNFNTGGTFATSNVTDGQNASPNNNTGTVTEPGQDGSYWLGRDNQPTGYFVIDLGAPTALGSFQLFNTRNGPYDDRGTGNFQIYGSNSVVAGPAGTGMDLSGAVLLVAGTLTEQTYVGGFGSQGSTPLVGDTFLISDYNQYRYLRFNALSIGAAADKGFGDAGVGLNEFRAFALLPEPASIAVWTLAGLGLVGFGYVRSQRKATRLGR